MDSQTKIALGFVRCMPKPLPKVCHVDLLPESTSRCSAWVAMAARAAFHARKSKYKPPRILSVTIAQEYVRMRTDIPNAAARPHISEPQTMPKARTSACCRPCDMAVDMMAMLLGPGLATPKV